MSQHLPLTSKGSHRGSGTYCVHEGQRNKKIEMAGMKTPGRSTFSTGILVQRIFATLNQRGVRYMIKNIDIGIKLTETGIELVLVLVFVFNKAYY